jgi:xanthosine utilization system XapX-like protein
MLSLNGEPLALAVLGLGGILLGLVELALACVKRSRTWPASVALAALLALAGGAAYAADLGPIIWQPALVLAGVAVALLLFRSPSSIAGRPVVQGAGMVLLSGVLLGSQLYRLDKNLEDDLLRSDFELSQMADPVDETSPPVVVATTDAGRSIPLFHVSADAATTSADEEARSLGELRLRSKVIQTGPPDVRFNCHGWVFGDGRGWIRSKMVDAILQDNAYQVVERPLAGDLAVFRNQLDEVTHSGVVRTGEKDGSVLIESKWGRYGRYVHTPDWHCYGADKVSYYRSLRGSHVLKGVTYARPESAIGG